MNKFALFTTTAIVAATLAFAIPVKAAEQGWFDSMKTKVQSWFKKDGQADSANAEVEAYLDQVTIAVPPMTGAEAAAIQPAAGDYVEEVEDQLNNTAPQPAAPGSVDWQRQSQFNTEFDGTQGSVTAFGDTPSADDLANIMPAAGDAEEITDESVVVVEETPAVTETVTETTVETTDGVVTEVEEVTTEVTTEEEVVIDPLTGDVAQ